jgi:hypothetical protein
MVSIPPCRVVYSTLREVSQSAALNVLYTTVSVTKRSSVRSEELCQLALSKSQMGGKVRGMLEAAKAQIQWYIERPQVGRFWWSGVGVEIEADYGAAHAQYH